MGNFFKNLGIGIEALKEKVEVSYSETIGLVNERKFYAKLIALFDEIGFTEWNGSWEENVNEWRRKKGVQRIYSEPAEFKEGEGLFKKLKWETFVKHLPKENPTDFEMAYFFDACLGVIYNGPLEWICPFRIDNKEISDCLKALRNKEEKYKEFFDSSL